MKPIDYISLYFLVIILCLASTNFYTEFIFNSSLINKFYNLNTSTIIKKGYN